VGFTPACCKWRSLEPGGACLVRTHLERTRRHRVFSWRYRGITQDPQKTGRVEGRPRRITGEKRRPRRANCGTGSLPERTHSPGVERRGLTDVAHPKHQEVRRRFAFRCGYCGVTEVDAGGELTVDHFHPVSAGGDDSDDNLVYACPRCNLHKSDILPVPNLSCPEQRLLHPLRDDVTRHIRENKEAGFLEPLTETGRFHIATLRLN